MHNFMPGVEAVYAGLAVIIDAKFIPEFCILK